MLKLLIALMYIPIFSFGYFSWKIFLFLLDDTTIADDYTVWGNK